MDDVVDRKSTVIDQIGRAIFRALRQLSAPLEDIIKTADIGVLGLPDVPGAGAKDYRNGDVTDEDQIHGGLTT